LKCKIVKIVNRVGHPSFHFEIDGKMYFYGIIGVIADNKIVLRCTKTCFLKSSVSCNNTSTVLPSDFLKQIIQKRSSVSTSSYATFLDKSDPRVYDIDTYDINSFDIGKGHKCPGIEIDVYLKSLNKLEEKPEIECKLVKIENSRGFPHLHFEINGKMYFYGIKGVRADNKIVLRCNKHLSGSSQPCGNKSTVLPSDVLKKIIQKTPSETKNRYAKILDKSDPRVYDIDNYDMNSFDIGKGHKCQGTEIRTYMYMCKQY
jgi:hypothetical protein